MRIRKLGNMLAILLAISCITMSACAKATETTTTSSDEVMSSDTYKDSETVDTSISESSDESYQEFEVIDISDTEKEIYVYRDDLRLYGKIYLPEGDGPFPVVIYSTGAGAPFSIYIDIVKELTKNGIAGVCFDFAGNTNPSKSEGDATKCSALTEAADLEAVLGNITTLDYLDSNNVFLWGHSMGGFVSAYVGCENPDTIRGMMLAEPSFQIHDEFRTMFPEGTEIPEVVFEPLFAGRPFFEDVLSFDIYEMLPCYSNNVLIFAGTEVPSIGAEEFEYLDRANSTFPSSELIAIEGADHNFTGESRAYMIELMVEFVTNNIL